MNWPANAALTDFRVQSIKDRKLLLRGSADRAIQAIARSPNARWHVYIRTHDPWLTIIKYLLMSQREYCRSPSWKLSQASVPRTRETCGSGTTDQDIRGTRENWTDYPSNQPLRGSAGYKRSSQDLIMSELSQCLDQSKLEIQRLNLLLEQKEKTIQAAVRQKDSGLVQLAAEIDRLEDELQKSKRVVAVLSSSCKNVSKRLDVILRIGLLAQVKLSLQGSLSTKNLGGTPKTSSSESQFDDAGKNLELSCSDVNQKLDVVEAKLRRLSTQRAQQPAIPPSPTPESRPTNAIDPARFAKLQEDKQQLERVLRLSEQTKYQLAQSMEENYLMIQKRMAQKKSHSSASTEDDVIVLLSRIGRLERQLQEYGVNIMKQQQEHTDQLKGIYAGIKESQKKHREMLETKERELEELKRRRSK